jgi:transposase InsO family protein
MPWKASTAMSQREEFVERALKEDANVRALCREFGITPRTGYKWLRRYQAEGPAGLYEHSRRPEHSPKRSGPQLEEAVQQARQAHPTWGGRKLRWLLARQGIEPLPSASTLTAILHRQQLIAPPESAPQRPLQRFERQAPNQLWQMDFKGHFRMQDGCSCHPLTVLDDHSRFLVGLEACRAERAREVRSRLAGIFECYGLPEQMLMDNGAAWPGYHTSLTYWLVRLGIQVLHGRPRHPQTQGKDERLHRTLEDELLRSGSFADLPDCQRAFDGWRQLYNYARPHEALHMQLPAAHYQPSLRTFTGRLPPIEYPPGDILRRTDVHGRIQFQGRRFHVGKAFRLSVVGVRPTQTDGLFHVYFFRQRIAQITLWHNQP